MNATSNDYQVAVIGGGITGLSAGWYLEQAGLSYALLEKSDYWGGKVRTEQVDGFGSAPFVVEMGPDSFYTRKPWAYQLVQEIGIEDRLLGTNDAARKVFVLNNGVPTRLPEGVLLIVPTKFLPFALSPLISLPGKMRMGLEMFIPPKRDGEDETLAEFIRRRLGSEALDKIAEPLMSGIYNAEAERQSLLATFPRFREMEVKYGSLTRGMLAAKRKRASAPPREGGPESLFMSFREGTQELPERLSQRLKGDLRLNTSVDEITRGQGGTYTLHLADGSRLNAANVVLATPSYVSAALLRDLAPEAAIKLDEIDYVSTGTISLGFREETFDHPLDGFGIVIPRSEDRPINAITFTSTKFDHRTPAGYVMVRIFFGGSRSPGSMALDDEALLATVRGELHAIMGIESEPVMHRIYRWKKATPQYHVGHLERVAAIESALPDGLYVAGSPYSGIGISDCARQAQEVIKKIRSSV